MYKITDLKNRPCIFDGNGDCESCGSWGGENCEWLRMWNHDHKYYSLEQQIELFKEILTPEQIKELYE